MESSTDIEILKEVVRLAEKKLDAQLAIISALAQRSGALASILGAGATAMLAAEIAMLNYLKIELLPIAYLVALIAPTVAYVGCVYCGRAAGTSKFFTTGNYPDAWKGNLTKDDMHEALMGELENYQSYITRNDQIIARLARYLRIGLRLGAASPIVLAAINFVFLFSGKCFD